jgi:hypothetical protein
MAVSRGQESTEGAVRKLFIGIGSSYILGVNPSKAELEKLYGRTQDKDPEYLGSVEVNGAQTPQIRLDFITKPDPEKYLDLQNQPIDSLIHVPIYLRRVYNFGSKSNKYQIIDKYGRTAWATREEIEARQIPVYQTKDGGTMQANISPDYIIAYEGLEELTKLIRAYLNIPTVEKWEGGKVVGLIDNPSDAEVLPDHIEDYFKGDIKELKEIFSFQTNNKVKIAYGVKTTPENKQYQAAYTRMFLKNNITSYDRLKAEIESTKNNGGLSNVEFSFDELHEYQVVPTNFTAQPAPSIPGISGQTPWGAQGNMTPSF